MRRRPFARRTPWSRTRCSEIGCIGCRLHRRLRHRRSPYSHTPLSCSPTAARGASSTDSEYRTSPASSARLRSRRASLARSRSPRTKSRRSAFDRACRGCSCFANSHRRKEAGTSCLALARADTCNRIARAMPSGPRALARRSAPKPRCSQRESSRPTRLRTLRASTPKGPKLRTRSPRFQCNRTARRERRAHPMAHLRRRHRP